MSQSGISPQAFESLIGNRERFVAFVRKHIHSPGDAEDIVQSAFTRSIEKGETVRDEESVVAWFYRVLRNAIIDHYRRVAVRDRMTEQYAIKLKDMETQLQFDPSARQEVCQCVWPVLETLKPEYRDALKLVDIEEHSLVDLAQSSNISENNAGVRLHRARRALKKQVEVTCGACATHGCVDCSCRKPT